MTRTRLVVPITAPTPRGTTTVAAELSRLTPRDLLLLDLLDRHRVLTTHQIAALGYGTSDRACKRATVLYRRGVLDRFRRWLAAGSAPWHWTLGPTGAAILAATHGTPVPRPAVLRERVDRLAASPQLAHLVGTNGFFVDLTAYARTHPGAELTAWRSERDATAECADLAHPDGAGVWRESSRTVAFWLEYDTGTERPLTRVSGKLTGYAHLLGTKVDRPVLFWLPSAVREANLAAHLTRVGIPAGLVVATASGEHAAGNGGPAGPVWALPGRAAGGRFRLADLPTPAGHRDPLA